MHEQASIIASNGSGRLLRWQRPTGEALVIGRFPPQAPLVDHAYARELGIEVVVRSTGGGAVLVAPGEMIWADVFVPAGDPLLPADAIESFHWLGGIWQQALIAAGIASTSLARPARRAAGGPVKGASGPARLACFASAGHGEVLVGGEKLVGLSQRRTRSGALFQCALPVHLGPERLAALFRLDAGQRRELVSAVRSCSTGLAALDQTTPPAAEIEACFETALCR